MINIKKNNSNKITIIITILSAFFIVVFTSLLWLPDGSENVTKNFNKKLDLLGDEVIVTSIKYDESIGKVEFEYFIKNGVGSLNEYTFTVKNEDGKSIEYEQVSSYSDVEPNYITISSEKNWKSYTLTIGVQTPIIPGKTNNYNNSYTTPNEAAKDVVIDYRDVYTETIIFKDNTWKESRIQDKERMTNENIFDWSEQLELLIKDICINIIYH